MSGRGGLTGHSGREGALPLHPLCSCQSASSLAVGKNKIQIMLCKTTYQKADWKLHKWKCAFPCIEISLVNSFCLGHSRPRFNVFQPQVELTFVMQFSYPLLVWVIFLLSAFPQNFLLCWRGHVPPHLAHPCYVALGRALDLGLISLSNTSSHHHHPCTAPTHARPSLPVNPKPILTPDEEYWTELHYIAATSSL